MEVLSLRYRRITKEEGDQTIPNSKRTKAYNKEDSTQNVKPSNSHEIIGVKRKIGATYYVFMYE